MGTQWLSILIIDCASDADYCMCKISCKNTTVNKYNLINSCGSVLLAINERKDGLLCHNIQKCDIQILSRKKSSISNYDRIYRVC
jgi:hypothetical protein